MINQIVPPPRPDVPQTLVAAIAQPRRTGGPGVRQLT
jgi:hypothetical protein